MSVAPFPDENWFCDACTFANSPFLNSCEICGAPRPNLSPPKQHGGGNAPTPSATDFLDVVTQQHHTGAEELVDEMVRVAGDSNDPHLFLRLLDKANNDIDARDGMGKTALISACCNNRHSVIKTILEHKPDLNIADYTGVTPLMGAIKNGNRLPVLLLLGHIETRKFPIDIAVEHEDKNILEWADFVGGTIREDVQVLMDEQKHPLVQHRLSVKNLKHRKTSQDSDEEFCAPDAHNQDSDLFQSQMFGFSLKLVVPSKLCIDLENDSNLLVTLINQFGVSIKPMRRNISANKEVVEIIGDLISLKNTILKITRNADVIAEPAPKGGFTFNILLNVIDSQCVIGDGGHLKATKEWSQTDIQVKDITSKKQTERFLSIRGSAHNITIALHCICEQLADVFSHYDHPNRVPPPTEEKHNYEDVDKTKDLDDYKCSFNECINTWQKGWQCTTCSMDGSLLFCTSCFYTCHRRHNCVSVGFRVFYCRCGAKGCSRSSHHTDIVLSEVRSHEVVAFENQQFPEHLTIQQPVTEFEFQSSKDHSLSIVELMNSFLTLEFQGVNAWSITQRLLHEKNLARVTDDQMRFWAPVVSFGDTQYKLYEQLLGFGFDFGNAFKKFHGASEICYKRFQQKDNLSNIMKPYRDCVGNFRAVEKKFSEQTGQMEEKFMELCRQMTEHNIGFNSIQGSIEQLITLRKEIAELETQHHKEKQAGTNKIQKHEKNIMDLLEQIKNAKTELTILRQERPDELDAKEFPDQPRLQNQASSELFGTLYQEFLSKLLRPEESTICCPNLHPLELVRWFIDDVSDSCRKCSYSITEGYYCKQCVYKLCKKCRRAKIKDNIEKRKTLLKSLRNDLKTYKSLKENDIHILTVRLSPIENSLRRKKCELERETDNIKAAILQTGVGIQSIVKVLFLTSQAEGCCLKIATSVSEARLIAEQVLWTLQNVFDFEVKSVLKSRNLEGLNKALSAIGYDSIDKMSSLSSFEDVNSSIVQKLNLKLVPSSMKSNSGGIKIGIVNKILKICTICRQAKGYMCERSLEVVSALGEDLGSICKQFDSSQAAILARVSSIEIDNQYLIEQ